MGNNITRKLPFDVDAEQQVLGACLLQPACLDALDLSAPDFYSERNAATFAAMLDMRREGIGIDFATVAERLDKIGKWQDSGIYLGGMVNATPTAFHVQDYARVVKDCAARRALISIAGDVAQGAYDLTSDLNARRADWIAAMTKLLTHRGRAEQVAANLFGLVDDIDERRKNPTAIYGIPTGFADWDRITNGVHRGEVFLLSGQPGMGKSLLAGQSAFQMAKCGYGVAYYALEMQSKAILRRQLSGMTSIKTGDMRSGRIADAEMDRLRYTASQLSALPLYMSDATHWNTASLRSDVARLKAQDDIVAVVVDHVALLKDSGDDPLELDKRKSQALHDIAKDFDVAVIGIHTMNKVGIRNGANPSQADAAGSVRWIYDADVVAFLTEHIPYNGEMKQDRTRTVTLAKFREDSPDRYFHLYHHKEIPRFENYQGSY